MFYGGVFLHALFLADRNCQIHLCQALWVSWDSDVVSVPKSKSSSRVPRSTSSNVMSVWKECVYFSGGNKHDKAM